MENIEVDDYELKQAKPCYTFETMQHFLKKYDKIMFLIGADNLNSLTKWYKFEELEKLVEFVVFSRNGKISEKYKTIEFNFDISSTEIRENLNDKFLTDKKIILYYKRIKMKQRIAKIVDLIDDKKGEEIESFDLTNSDYFVDAVVIATTMAQKHEAAILDHLKENLKPQESFLNVEESDDWIVIDLGDILIHLMSKDYREKYQLDKFLKEFGK